MLLSLQEKGFQEWVKQEFPFENLDNFTMEDWHFLYRVYAAIVETLVDYRTM